MADKKISALTAATTPLAGTEVLPVVQSGATVKVSVADLTAGRTVALRNANLTGGAAVINIGAVGDTSYHYTRYIDNGNQSFFLGVDDNAGAFFGAGAYGRVLYSEGSNPLKVFVNGAYRAEYDTSGNYKLDTGNLVVGTAGKGIDFSANTHAAGMTSELLDWYEEGTFTPSFNQGFTAPVSYTTQTGRYTRIGDMVYFHAYIYMAAGQTRNADPLALAGLPFAVASNAYISLVWNYAAGVVAAGTALPTVYSGGVFYNTGGAAFLGTSLTSARPEVAISGFYKTT